MRIHWWHSHCTSRLPLTNFPNPLGHMKLPGFCWSGVGRAGGEAWRGWVKGMIMFGSDRIQSYFRGLKMSSRADLALGYFSRICNFLYLVSAWKVRQNFTVFSQLHLVILCCPELCQSLSFSQKCNKRLLLGSICCRCLRCPWTGAESALSSWARDVDAF